MTQFIVAIDPSRERRTSLTDAAKRRLASESETAVNALEHGDVAVVSASRTWEPFQRGESDRATWFIWGRALPREPSTPRSALDLPALWRGLPDRVPAALEGIHAALLVERSGSWSVAADILGTMPVYYLCGPDYVLVGSTPELFCAHPDFRPELDPSALAGLLLTNGLVANRALLRGIRRLGAGNVLHAQSGQLPKELAQYRPEASDRYFGSSYEENFRRMEAALDRCFDRHLPRDASYNMILSGGLDSRLVAGMAHARDLRVAAYSFGSRSDIEAQCAAGVARSLGWRHTILPIRMDRFVEYADAECKWKHLANGFGGIDLQEPIPEPQNVQAMLSGYTMETVLGSDHTAQAGPDAARMSFAQLFSKVNRWGLPVDTVKRLMRKSYATTVVDDVLSELEQTYRSYGTRDFQRAWLFDQFHRERYHTAGVLGLHGRWPWPAVAYVDTEMMDVMAAMPYEHVKHRRMQFDLLKRRFPALARLPLDRNGFNVKPVASRYGRVVSHVLFKPRELYYRWTRGLVERRFYYRTMAFDSPGWNAVRAAAEPHRGNAQRILDASVLAEVLPQPAAPLNVADGIIDTSKMKLMTGFLLWLARYA
jgi:asparagine synthase (glutamine-hydrolysing)